MLRDRSNLSTASMRPSILAPMSSCGSTLAGARAANRSATFLAKWVWVRINVSRSATCSAFLFVDAIEIAPPTWCIRKYQRGLVRMEGAARRKRARMWEGVACSGRLALVDREDQLEHRTAARPIEDRRAAPVRCQGQAHQVEAEPESALVVPAPLDRAKPLEHDLLRVLRDAGSAIGHVDPRAARFGEDVHLHAIARARVLEGVGNEVLDAPPGELAVDSRDRIACRGNRKLDLARPGLALQRLGCFPRDLGEAHTLELQAELAFLQHAHLEDLVEQGAQAVGELKCFGRILLRLDG